MTPTKEDMEAAKAYADLPNETFTRQLETLGHLCNLELGFIAGIEHEREKSQMAAANARLDQEWPIQKKLLRAIETINTLQAKLEIYKKALEFYAGGKHWDVQLGFGEIVTEKGRLACAALVEASGAEGGK